MSEFPKEVCCEFAVEPLDWGLANELNYCEARRKGRVCVTPTVGEMIESVASDAGGKVYFVHDAGRNLKIQRFVFKSQSQRDRFLPTMAKIQEWFTSA